MNPVVSVNTYLCKKKPTHLSRKLRKKNKKGNRPSRSGDI
jgi:hypothetical protein